MPRNTQNLPPNHFGISKKVTKCSGFLVHSERNSIPNFRLTGLIFRLFFHHSFSSRKLEKASLWYKGGSLSGRAVQIWLLRSIFFGLLVHHSSARWQHFFATKNGWGMTLGGPTPKIKTWEPRGQSYNTPDTLIFYICSANSSKNGNISILVTHKYNITRKIPEFTRVLTAISQ